MTDKIQYIELEDMDCVLNNLEGMPQGLYIRYQDNENADFADLRHATELLGYTERKKICIVGARKHTDYGVLVIGALLREVAPYNPIIISGLAEGIDTIALETALKYKLDTIAVIGSGLDDHSIYPRSNILLAYDICKSGGIIISEYPEGEKPMKWNFPARNRIMAGLADTIIVIEGTRKSGTLITARLGAEYGKDVIAVPGSIFSPLSAGPLSLIEHGATPLIEPSNILTLLNLVTEEELEKVRTSGLSGPGVLGTCKDKQLKSEKYHNCSEAELSILHILDQPRDRNEILSEIDIKAGDLQILLIQMEMRQLITEKYGKIVRL